MSSHQVALGAGLRRDRCDPAAAPPPHWHCAGLAGAHAHRLAPPEPRRHAPPPLSCLRPPRPCAPGAPGGRAAARIRRRPHRLRRGAAAWRRRRGTRRPRDAWRAAAARRRGQGVPDQPGGAAEHGGATLARRAPWRQARAGKRRPPGAAARRSSAARPRRGATARRDDGERRRRQPPQPPRRECAEYGGTRHRVAEETASPR